MFITKILQDRLDANNCQRHDNKTDTEWFNEQILLFVQEFLLPLCKKPHTCTITYQLIYSNLIDHFSQNIDTFYEKDIPDLLSKANYMMLMTDIPSLHDTDAVFWVNGASKSTSVLCTRKANLPAAIALDFETVKLAL